MKILILITTILIITTPLQSQDTYQGQFSKTKFFLSSDKEVPIDYHEGYDADEGISIATNYTENGAFKDIAVKIKSDTICYKKLNFPPDEIEWVEIKKGLWINLIGEKEQFA